jgi:uncharacterized protein YabN with tetrapyrrole methylase and pyrophosphatase domain
MDMESVKIITEGVVEIAKTLGPVLGPAIITALVGYKVGKSQIEVKLRELEKTYAYSASEKLFDYYQNREKELNESYNSINKDMGFLLGMTSALTENDELLNNTIKMYDLYEKTLPYQIKLTLRDLKKYNLQETEEFRKLESFLDQKALHDQKKNWSDKVFYLLEIYFYLQICNKMILEEISTNYMKIFVKK